jgi:hypothetical protein
VLLALATTLANAPAGAGEVCKPRLSVKHLQLAEATPSQLRKWTATVTADASRCATTAGSFEIGILREKEDAPDEAFRERFTWSAPSTLIALDLWQDEAVGEYWIYRVLPCPCAYDHGEGEAVAAHVPDAPRR